MDVLARATEKLLSARLTNVAAADFTNLVGSVEQGYTAFHWLRTCFTFCLLPFRPGSPTLNFLLSLVGPLPPP